MNTATDDSHSRRDCCACGSNQSAFATELNTPFQSKPFDFSPGAYQAARGVIEEGTQRVSDLNLAIEKLTSIRDSMKLVVNQHRNFVSPINRLPDDVLLHILEHLTGRINITQAWIVAPWDFYVVCRRWRGLALSHNYFWADIQLVLLEDDSVAHIQRECRRAEIQLERSIPCTLDVQVYVPDLTMPASNVVDVIEPLLEKTLRNLLASSSRCRLLEVEGCIPEHWDVYPVPTSVYDQLEIVNIKNNSWLQAPFLFNTPVLDTVFLQDLHHITPKDMVFSWSAVSEINLIGCTFEAAELLGMLRLAGPLRVLHIEQPMCHPASFNGLDTTSMQPTHLPELEDLSLSLRSCSSMDFAVTRHIIAPSLSELRLEDVSIAESHLIAVEELIRNSDISSSLKLLEVKGCELSTWLLPLLQVLAGLEELRVIVEQKARSGNTAALLVALCSRNADNNSTPLLCPKLQRLVIKKDQVDLTHLKTAIQSRARTTAGDSEPNSQAFLEHVYVEDSIFTGMEHSNTFFQWFEDLKRNGRLDSKSEIKPKQ